MAEYTRESPDSPSSPFKKVLAMNILECAREVGLSPKRVASTNGGEYASACPACHEGVDRFRMWPDQGRYWCRQCQASGDIIQFCRDFLGLTFQEACHRSNKEPNKRIVNATIPEFLPKISTLPPVLWREKAACFVNWSYEQLLLSPAAMEGVLVRGFHESSIAKYKIGYCRNPDSGQFKDLFRNKADWGLASTPSNKLWLPHGIVIPTFRNGEVVKLKIRRSDWKPGEPHKYVVVSGSMKAPALFGDLQLHVSVVVESEFDAMLLQQEAGDVCSCIALGGLGKPDLETHHLLSGCPLVLFALDFDEPGKKAYSFWKSAYSKLRAWPVPITKSPGDALLAGVNLRQWVLDGLKHYKR